MSTSKARLEAVERAGLRCRELEEQLEMRQASLRAAQVEASSLEGQVAACESEQVTLQQQMRKTDASNAALAQRLSSLEEHRRQETSCASAQTRQSEGAKADLERQLQAERAARQTQLERVASALRASAAACAPSGPAERHHSPGRRDRRTTHDGGSQRRRPSRRLAQVSSICRSDSRTRLCSA